MRSDRSSGRDLPTLYVSDAREISWNVPHSQDESRQWLLTAKTKRYRETNSFTASDGRRGRALYLRIPTKPTAGTPFAASSVPNECAADWSSQKRVPSMAPMTSIAFTRCYRLYWNRLPMVSRANTARGRQGLRTFLSQTREKLRYTSPENHAC